MKKPIIMLLAVILCFPSASCLAQGADDFVPNTRNIPAALEEIPAAYFQPSEHAGTMVRLDYTTWESFTYEEKTQQLNKTAWVYLPYGYSDANTYNVFYFMHGGWSNETTQLGTDERPSVLKHVIDHAFADGKMQPMIIVCPTYNNTSSEDSGDYGLAIQLTDQYHNELLYDLMPERIDNVVELTLSTKEEKLYRQMERDMLLPYADGDVLALNAATLAGKLLQLSNGAVYDEFHNIRIIHDRKLDALEDLIEAANGKPVLVMYAYQHDLTRIHQRFGKYSLENPDGVRELKTSEDMEDWNAGRIAVAVTQPASTGHGLNLQHGSSTIVWFGLNWSLELYEQANARLWRQGQKETVVVHHLVVKGTMDEQVMKALRDKAADQNALLAAVKARIQEVT